MRRLHAKALSVLLSVALVLSSLPAPAIAEMTEEATGIESNSAPAASGDTGVAPAPEAEAPGDGGDDSEPAAQETPTEPAASGDTGVTPAPEPQAPSDGADNSEVAAQQDTPAAQETPEPASGEEDERTVSAGLEQEAVDMPADAPNDELFAAYAQRLIDESISGDVAETGAMHAVRSAQDGLTGPNLVCYDKLKAMVRGVAAGDVTEAVVGVRCSELGADSFGPWTAEDLGVPSVFVDGYVPLDAFAKVRERLGVDKQAIMNAVRVDCPYDLYWFDATAQDAYAVGMTGIKVRTVGGQDALDVTDATLTFELRVAQEYHPGGDAGRAEVDPSKIEAVKYAVARAKGIVFDPGKAGMDVQERLVAYKDAICAAVAYNHNAADDDDMPYGNPWQLVWVFDGDPTTNVVCEGYAKAFKYLCDLTWPNREGGVECLIASGRMSGGTGGGNHMWNVVRMDDGRNYLVDVTNCDEGTAGAPSKLFLAYGPTGSYDEGYTFVLDGVHGITYEYDSDTKEAFGEDALTISAWAYASPSQPMVAEPPVAATDLVYSAREQVGVADNVWYTLSGTVAATDAGDYTATATLMEGCRWSDGTTSPKTISWSIARRPVTVTADFKTKVIGQADPPLTATVDGTLGDDTVSYSLSRESGEYVGGFAITPSGQALQGNYSVTFLPGRLSIKEHAATVLHSGTWGTCPWEIADDGTLTVYPGVGGSQSDKNSSPWSAYGGSITAVRLESQGESRVVLPACSRCLFYDLPEVVSMDLSGASTSQVTDMGFMFARCSSLASLDLSGWNTSSVTDMYAMFNVCSSLASLDISSFDTTNVKSMGYMFSGCSSLLSLDVSGLNTSNVTDMGFMFYYCLELSELNVSGLATSQVANMDRTFGCCQSLVSLDVSGFDTSRTTNMHGMFYDCPSLSALDVSHFDTSRATDMGSMFYNCSSLTSLGVSSFGTSRVTRMDSMFSHCSSLSTIDVSRWNTSSVTDMRSMFYGCSSLPALDVSGFDTSSVTDMRFTFSGCSSLPALDVSGFDTSQVADMRYMFADCSSLSALDVSGFDTSRVTDMAHLFSGCSSLSSLNLSGWNTSSVTDMNSMFWRCGSLENLDLSAFDTSKVGDMRSMFQYCTRLATLDVSSFDTFFVPRLSEMYYGCSSLSEIRVGTGAGANLLKEFPRFRINGTYDWYSESLGRIISREELALRVGVADTYSKGQNAPVDIGGMTVDLSGVWAVWDGTAHTPAPTVRLGDEVLTPGVDYYLTYSDNVDVGTATVTAHGRGTYSGTCTGRFEIVRRPVTVTANTQIKTYGSADPALTATVEGTLGGDTINYTVSREPGEQTGVYAVTPSGQALQGNYSVTFVSGWLTIRGESSTAIFVGKWGTCDWEVAEDGTLTVHQGEGASQTTQTSSPWADYSDAITSVVFDGGSDNGRVRLPANCWRLFSGLDKITAVDFSGVDTTNVTSMYGMFNNCSLLAAIDLSRFDTSQVTNMGSMFSGCSSLSELDVSGWNTSNVTNMGTMFSGCSKLSFLDVSGWNTSNVTNMGSMFHYCSKLSSIDVSSWSMSNVTNMSYMFNGCSILASLDVSRWNTSNVTNMRSVFNDCPSLSSLDVSGWDTSSVTNMVSMFYNCSSLTSLDVSGFDTSHVTNVHLMFSGCSSLPTIDVSRWNTSSVTDMGFMFSGCSSLTSLDVSGFDTSHVTDMRLMFSRCSLLHTIDVSRWNTSSVTDMGSMFFGCSTLTSLDVSGFDTSSVTDMSQMFSNCSNLSSLSLSGFDTSHVTNMSDMFLFCSSLPALDLSGFTTSSVTNMNQMFKRCSNLSSLSLSGWNTSSVADMGSMFFGCSNLSSLSLSGWNTSSVTDMTWMFYNCQGLSSLDLSGWNTSSVTDMQYMFAGCNSLASLDLFGFVTSNANESRVFSGCTLLTQIRVGSGVGSNLLGELPSTLINGTYDWYSGELGRIISRTELVARAGIADTYSKRQNPGTIDIRWATVDLAGVSETYDGFGHRPTPTVRLGDKVLMPGSDFYLTYSDNVNAGTATVTVHGWGEYCGTCSGTFEIARRSVTVTADDKSKTVGENNPALTATVEGTLGGDTVDYTLSRDDGETIGVYAITPYGQALQGNYSVTFVPGRFTIRGSSQTVLYSGTWGTCSWEITNDGMLAVYPGVGESQTNKWSSPWDEYRDSVVGVRLVSVGGSKVILPECSQNLFGSLAGASSMDLSGADASRVKDMSDMFWWCTSLTSVDLSGWDTSKVTNMSYMFYGCRSLSPLDASGFNTSSVTNMGGMFSCCSSLESLDLSHFNTSQVTNMNSMFDGCSSLPSLDLSNFNTSQVTDMSWMFYGCSSLSSLDLSGFDTTKVTSVSGVFSYCSSLSQIEVGSGVGSNLLRAFPTYEINGVSGWYSATLGQEFSVDELAGRGGIPDRYTKGQDAGSIYIGGATVDPVVGLEVYDGTEHTPSPTVRLGDKVLMPESDYYLTYENNVNAGTATVTVHGFGAYSGTCTGTFEIARRSVTVRADDKYKVEGDGDPALTASVEGTVGDDSVSYTLFRAWGEDPGQYAISPYGQTIQGNYNVTFVSGMLTIRDFASFVLYSGTWGTCPWRIDIDGTLSVYPGVGESQLSKWYSPWDEYKNSITSVRLVTQNGSKVVLPECSQCLFSNLSETSSIDLSGADSSRVTDMGSMFWWCTSLTSVDVSGLDTSRVTNMGNLFYCCSSLSSIDVSGFDTSKVTAMTSMFDSCSSLDGLDVSGFDLSQVNDVSYMFWQCSSLSSLDLSGWNTSQVTTMYGMFYCCSSLAEVKVGAGVGSNLLSIFPNYKVNGTYDWCSKALGRMVTAEELAGRGGIPDTYWKPFTGADIAEASIDPVAGWEVYDGTEHTPSVTVRLGDKILTPLVDYYLTYENNKNAGTATVTAHGIEAYSGSVSGTFEIHRASSTLSARAIESTVDCARGSTSASSNVAATGVLGTVSYGNASADTVPKTFAIDARTGRVSVPAKTPVGSFSVCMCVSDSGDANHEAGTAYVTYSVRVTFPDVPSSAWFANVVWRAAELGLISGYNDGRFGPNDRITRGQVAVILWNMAGEPDAGPGAKSFPDVSAGDYFYRAVRWASSKGVVSGYANGKFGPNDDVTREQLAVMLANYAKNVAGRLASGSVADFASMKDAARVSLWAVPSVGWCFKNQILSGTGDGRVNPQGNATRAEAAKMIVYLHDLLV